MVVGNIVQHRRRMLPVKSFNEPVFDDLIRLTHIAYYSASLAEEAKRWFEAATIICRFTLDGKLRATKVRPTAFLTTTNLSGLPGRFPTRILNCSLVSQHGRRRTKNRLQIRDKLPGSLIVLPRLPVWCSIPVLRSVSLICLWRYFNAL